VFWYDGLKETPKIPGVPDGEWLGDPPSLPGAGGRGGGRGAADRGMDGPGSYHSTLLSRWPWRPLLARLNIGAASASPCSFVPLNSPVAAARREAKPR